MTDDAQFVLALLAGIALIVLAANIDICIGKCRCKEEDEDD